MSILSQNLFDPIKEELGQDVSPLVDTFFTDLQAAAQKFTASLPSSVAGQSGALALNTLIGLAGIIGPTLVHAELAKFIPSMPVAPAIARQS